MAEAKPKKKRSKEGLSRKKERDRSYAKSRINIGKTYQRWREFRELNAFNSDAQVASFLLDSPTSMSSASLCYAEGCANGDNLLQRWSMNKCGVHGCFLGLDCCTCDPPFRLFPFPTRKQDPERRQKWIQAFERPDPRNLKKPLPPRPCHRVCSAHFVDGAPSEANPNPTLNLRPSTPVRGNNGSRPQGLKRRRIDGPNPAPAPLPTEIAAPSAVFYTLSVIIGVLLSLWRKAVKEKDVLSMDNCKLKAEMNQLRSQVSKLKGDSKQRLTSRSFLAKSTRMRKIFPELIKGLQTNRATESKEKSTALPEPLTSRNGSDQHKETQNWSIIGVQPHKTGPAPSQALEVMSQEQAKSQPQLAVQTAAHPVMNGCQVYWIYQPVVQPVLVAAQQTSINNQVASISNSSTQQPSTNNQMASISYSSTQQPSTINQMASISNCSTQQTSTNNLVDSNYDSPGSSENVKTEPAMVSFKCEDTEGRTEGKAGSLMSREQENVLNSIKKEEKEEDWEKNSVKTESDIKVRAEDVCLKKEEEG